MKDGINLFVKTVLNFILCVSVTEFVLSCQYLCLFLFPICCHFTAWMSVSCATSFPLSWWSTDACWSNRSRMMWLWCVTVILLWKVWSPNKVYKNTAPSKTLFRSLQGVFRLHFLLFSLIYLLLQLCCTCEWLPNH